MTAIRASILALLLLAIISCATDAQAQAEAGREVRETSARREQSRLLPGALATGVAVPRLIRFSGIVSDVPPHSAALGISFAQYKDQSGSAPLWQEVQNVAVDATGHYTVLLGAASKDGIPAELFTTNEARWLGVQVENQAEQARILLVSVPYALKAGDAETVGGHPVSNFVMTAAADTFRPIQISVEAIACSGLSPAHACFSAH